MLSREEVERRLACSFPADHSNEVVALMGGFEREALQTAQSLFAERDEPKGQCVRWEAMYEGMMAERDGLTEDVERLREALKEDVAECAAWCDVDKGCLACHRFDTCKKRAALEGRD